MRIERTGKVARLTPRVEAFIQAKLNGVACDDTEDPEQLRIDYVCLDGLLQIEIKTLEEDGSARMDNLTDQLRQRDDWPLFLGSAPIQAFIDRTNDPTGLHKQVLNRVGRAIINHVKKANRQLRTHKERFPRSRSVAMLVLINEDHEAYNPEVVAYILWHAVRRNEGGQPLYEAIDLIVYMTERHAQVIDNRLALPTLIIEGPSVDIDPWKSDIGRLFVERWAKWNKMPLYARGPDDLKFETIEHIPEIAPRHERWRIDYRRRPYLRHLTFDQLRDRFDEIMLVSTLGFLKDPPIRIAQADTMKNMEAFTHLMEEMGFRGIPVTDVPYETERAISAANRLRMPQAVVAWIVALDSRRGSSS